jgi:hypothetical protein
MMGQVTSTVTGWTGAQVFWVLLLAAARPRPPNPELRANAV